MLQNNTPPLKAWLILSQLSALTPGQWIALSGKAGLTLDALVDSMHDGSLGLGKKVLDRLPRAAENADLAMKFLRQNPDVACISFGCPDYPTQLENLSHPPAVLFVKGNPAILSAAQIAIVGSRHATANGMDITHKLAFQLADQGFVITSGLARGIDSSAHRGAISAGNTIAVLGSGIDVCYPQYHQHLYHNIIASGGAVVSEFLPGTPPRAHQFPRRNRVVAALAKGVLVVEAKLRSGSLITANLAADLGKEVFAVPGNINHPLSEGVNWLIQQGAKLVSSCTDIFEEFGISYEESVGAAESSKKPLARDRILDSVDYDVTSLSTIAARSKLSNQVVLTALLEYELRGLVAAVPGGYLKLGGK